MHMLMYAQHLVLFSNLQTDLGLLAVFAPRLGSRPECTS
jgi:hypothetical protein